MADKRSPEQVKGLDGTCATVRVRADNEDGYAVINEHDFDPAVHELAEPAAEPEKKSKKAK